MDISEFTFLSLVSALLVRVKLAWWKEKERRVERERREQERMREKRARENERMREKRARENEREERKRERENERTRERESFKTCIVIYGYVSFQNCN